MRRRPILDAVLIVALTALVYAIDWTTGVVPDVSGLYLVPVVLAAYWLGLFPAVAVAFAALTADFVLHPSLHWSTLAAHSSIHLLTYSFAAYVTALLRRQLNTIRMLNERRDYELELARRLTDAVADRYLVSAEGPYDVAVRSRPSRELGGDQVLIRSTEKGLFLCIADISGKGVSAALFASMLQSRINEAVDASPAPRDVIQRVNIGMLASLPSEMFVTMLCCLVHDERLSFVNAGHEPGYVTGSGLPVVRLLTPTGLPLGVSADLDVQEAVVPFAAESWLTCYSDGITDSDGFGGDRLKIESFVQRSSASTAAELADSLMAAAGVERQRDDMSVLVVRALSERMLPE